MTGQQHLSLESAYEQIVKSHHFYLNWRHGIVAGYLVILWALVAAIGWMLEHEKAELVWLACVVGALLSLWAWALEYRTRVIYRQCEDAAKECEVHLPVKGMLGLYHHFDKNRDSCFLERLRTKFVSHSFVIDLLFWSNSVWFGRIAFKLVAIGGDQVARQLIVWTSGDWLAAFLWLFGATLIVVDRVHGYRQDIRRGASAA